MLKPNALLFFLTLFGVSYAQETELPTDFRQHNLTELNGSFLTPVKSLDINGGHSIGVWSRWQWQSIDGDPTTVFLNYNGRLNAESAIGVGFFQHNTGTFLNTGAVINYAYSFDLGNNMAIAVGLNLFGFQKELADDNFRPNPDIILPELEVSTDFIVQFAPGVRFVSNGFSIGFASENIFDYNFSTSESDSKGEDKIYLAMTSYDFPLLLGNLDDVVLRPTVYLKTVPNQDTQFGLNTLLSTSKFWAQAGYNSFYGISGGAGAKLLKSLALGALIEFGGNDDFGDQDPSFELIAAYNFGQQDTRKKIVGFDVDDEEVIIPEEEVVISKPKEEIKEPIKEIAPIVEDKTQKPQRETRAQRKKREQDSIQYAQKIKAAADARRLAEQRRLDSVAKVQLAEAAAAKKQAELQKIAQQEKEALEKAQQEIAQQEEAARPKANERYEEVATEDGLSPGYYLIANVFGTKKYFDGFMKTLREAGMQPGSFYRSVNKYNYVYLGRYNTMQEARRARDSKFFGKYEGKTWIFRVVGE